MTERLVVRGAREHNLDDISVDLPRDRMIVLTGISGSGKSSLAFDTIYAEGQRRCEEMQEDSAALRFEYAARVRDEIQELKKELRHMREAV